MVENRYLTVEELEKGLGIILNSPKNDGTLDLIVRRPAIDQREILVEGTLDPAVGLQGDTWAARSNPDRLTDPYHLETQVTLMNSRVIALLAQDKERWPLAGDQLYIDFDLSVENIPPGTRLALGSAVVQISARPHTGCSKFLARFGPAALDFVNSPQGKQLHLRGINARVIQPGKIRVGDSVSKVK